MIGIIPGELYPLAYNALNQRLTLVICSEASAWPA